MNTGIRVRPTALIIQDDAVLLIEYNEAGHLHYNLPGGGIEPGESVHEGLRRELREEAGIEIEIGPLAFVYEYYPGCQSGDYASEQHGLHLIFNCKVPEGSIPVLPETPDLNQVAVKWVTLEQLASVVLYPNLKQQIADYADNRRQAMFLEDHLLPGYASGVSGREVQ